MIVNDPLCNHEGLSAIHKCTSNKDLICLFSGSISLMCMLSPPPSPPFLPHSFHFTFAFSHGLYVICIQHRFARMKVSTIELIQWSAGLTVIRSRGQPSVRQLDNGVNPISIPTVGLMESCRLSIRTSEKCKVIHQEHW